MNIFREIGKDLKKIGLQSAVMKQFGLDLL